MSQHLPFRKISACNGCLYYGCEPYLLCAVQPYGAQGEVCADFQADPNWQQFLQLDWVREGEQMPDVPPLAATPAPGKLGGTREGATVSHRSRPRVATRRRQRLWRHPQT